MDPFSKITQLEPIATHPNFRKLGLAKLLIYEGLRRAISMILPFSILVGLQTLQLLTSYTIQFVLLRNWPKKLGPKKFKVILKVSSFRILQIVAVKASDIPL